MEGKKQLGWYARGQRRRAEATRRGDAAAYLPKERVRLLLLCLISECQQRASELGCSHSAVAIDIPWGAVGFDPESIR